MTQETNEPTLVERVEETQTSLFSKVKNVAVPLTAAALAGGATFAGVDISSLDEPTLTYVFNPYTTAAVPVAAVGVGIAAHKYAGKLWNGIKWLADKATEPFSRTLSGGEDPKLIQNAFQSRKVKGCAVLGIAGLVGGAATTVAGDLPTTVDPKPALNWIQTKYEEQEFPGERNIYFLENYVLGSPLDGIPRPPNVHFSGSQREWTDLQNRLTQWEKEHEKQLAMWTLGNINYKKYLKSNGGIVPVYELNTFNQGSIGSVWYINDTIVGQACFDYQMQAGHPDQERKQLELITLDGKLFAFVWELADDQQQFKAGTGKIRLYEFGKSKPLIETQGGDSDMIMVPFQKKGNEIYLIFSRLEEGKESLYRADMNGNISIVPESDYEELTTHKVFLRPGLGRRGGE